MADDRKIIPFGKYKGRPLEVMTEDKQYTDWLLAQPWFRERFESYYTIIVNNFGEPAETPDHNAMQAEFLDPKFQLQFACRYVTIESHLNWIQKCWENRDDKSYPVLPLEAACAIENNEPLTREMFGTPKINIDFEVRGWDVVLKARWDEFLDSTFLIELKPQLADDYPTVLRQIKARKMESYEHRGVLLIRQYAGIGATLAQVKQIFSLSRIKLILRSEVGSL